MDSDAPMDAGQRPQRRGPRFRAELAVGYDGGEGVTRDVSASGVYFVTQQPFAVNSRISFTIDFRTSDGVLRAVCDGLVTRVEAVDGSIGVAAEFSSMTLAPMQPGDRSDVS